MSEGAIAPVAWSSHRWGMDALSTAFMDEARPSFRSQSENHATEFVAGHGPNLKDVQNKCQRRHRSEALSVPQFRRLAAGSRTTGSMDVVIVDTSMLSSMDTSAAGAVSWFGHGSFVSKDALVDGYTSGQGPPSHQSTPTSIRYLFIRWEKHPCPKDDKINGKACKTRS